ncbi:MAG: hypothetical protein GTO14_06265 [Anaerolineales bacterium]|nr:hypothetical protein [Anaerolineales bacterium]
MKRTVFFRVILYLVFISLLPSCAGRFTEIPPIGSVTFNIPIHAEDFSESASLRIVIWDADQLKILARTAGCAISFDLESQTEEVHCPEGVEYEEVTPEEYTFPLEGIGESIEIESSVISVGERYRLRISGLSNDDCNTTSATVEGVAQTASITFEELMWGTTLMACP